MAKLNQIIAIEKGSKSNAYSVLSELNKILQKPELFNGFTKVYSKRDEDGEDLPSESRKVQKTVRGILAQVMDAQSDSWYVTARKEWTNCTAHADIVVDDMTLAEGVPVTFLLQLEKHLTDLRTFIANLPTLDTNEDWQEDINSGLHKTAAVQTGRTKKTQRPIVLYDATPEHPAQTQIITEDVLAGYWNTTKQSGAIPVPIKDAYCSKVERLLRAVKEAREAANNIDEVQPPHIERALLSYIFSE